MKVMTATDCAAPGPARHTSRPVCFCPATPPAATTCSSNRQFIVIINRRRHRYDAITNTDVAVVARFHFRDISN